MVVTLRPATAETGATHERMVWPSTCTVQAPHCATPQPNLVPVRPISSRSTQSSGVCGSASTRCDWPLTLSETTVIAKLREEERRPQYARASEKFQGFDDAPDDNGRSCPA